jgi:hypothetical protein
MIGRPLTPQICSLILLYREGSLGISYCLAKILSIDQDTVVGEEPLDQGTYEVLVNVATKKDATLPYKYADLRYIGDAVTSSIAWPAM